MMAGLTRKKITVRRKGKTFQRSVMVRAEAIGKRAKGGKLNAMNPWQPHHTELVNGRFPKSQGSSGPGSDHSYFAILTARYKGMGIYGRGHAEPYTAEAAALRRHNAIGSANLANQGSLGRNIGWRIYSPETKSTLAVNRRARMQDLEGAFGARVTHVPRRSSWGG